MLLQAEMTILNEKTGNRKPGGTGGAGDGGPGPGTDGTFTFPFRDPVAPTS